MERQSTPLHKAALKGLFEAVKILTERGAQLDCEDEAGYTALQISAFQGFDNIVALLLSKGANVNHQDEVFAQSWPAVTQQLTPVAWKSGDGYTALQLACQEGHVKVIATLLGNGGDVDLQNDVRW
jgi:ankyrin repeat protein